MNITISVFFCLLLYDFVKEYTLDVWNIFLFLPIDLFDQNKEATNK